MDTNQADPVLRDLLDEGEELLRRIERIKDGALEKLHLQELVVWVGAVERCEFAKNAAIPEKGDSP